jgi:hypothetical protein
LFRLSKIDFSNKILGSNIGHKGITNHFFLPSDGEISIGGLELKNKKFASNKK